jgi:LysM repeat protein
MCERTEAAASGGMGAGEWSRHFLRLEPLAMPPIVRMLTVAGVLASGLGIASLFKKPPAAPAVAPRDATADWRCDAPQIVLGPARSAYGLAPPSPVDIAPPSVALTDGSQSGPGVVDAQDRLPPMLPLRSPLSSTPQIVAAPADNEPVSKHSPIAASRAVDSEDKETPAPPSRHRIVDGDSLEKIAQRYLGDRARWPDVYQVNRDVLAAPSALPIGVELRIPPRSSPGTTPGELPMVPLRRIGQ